GQEGGPQFNSHGGTLHSEVQEVTAQPGGHLVVRDRVGADPGLVLRPFHPRGRLRELVRPGTGLVAVQHVRGLKLERQELQKPQSEEHTSELQSRENLVCRLMLEKKKK